MDNQECLIENLRSVLQLEPTSQEDRLRQVACVFDILTTPDGSNLLLSSYTLRDTIIRNIATWTEQLKSVRTEHPELSLQCRDIAKSILLLLNMCDNAQSQE